MKPTKKEKKLYWVEAEVKVPVLYLIDAKDEKEARKEALRVINSDFENFKDVEIKIKKVQEQKPISSKG